MHKRLSVSLLFALLLVATRAEAQFRAPAPSPEDYHVELGLMFWQPDPELTLTTDSDVLGAVDFVNVFALGEETFREFRVTLKPGRKHKIRFAYVPLQYEAEAVLQETISFGGQTFPVSADAATDIDWQVYRFGYEWDFVSMPGGFLGLVTDLKYNRVTANVSASGTVFGTVAAEVDQNAPVPTLGAAARGYLGRAVSIGGEFTALKLNRDEFRVHFYDFDINGAVHLGRYVGVQAGYRSMDVDYLIDEDAGTMVMKGPYFGGFVRF